MPFAEADERRLGLAVHRRELLDVGDREAGDRRHRAGVNCGRISRSTWSKPSVCSAR